MNAVNSRAYESVLRVHESAVTDTAVNTSAALVNIGPGAVNATAAPAQPHPSGGKAS
ncbi:hypothetical protein [Streptomyces alboflavus]|uniref:hypothetical protein n=1 Tax=Streptomyces alboflavus TaxID=67267 RepID=UPI000A511622|nr:hypothetical protein [Streptomyces alboflavus]